MKYLYHRNETIPLIGIGTWTIGDDYRNETKEIETIKAQINNYEMTLIDTAEMYGDGKSEKVIGKAIKGIKRNKLFIIGKILPENAIKNNYLKSCQTSLANLGIEYFDVYLLHWRSQVDLESMIQAMEQLIQKGLIKHWGVSNFDVDDMTDLFSYKGGNNCFLNQCLYNISARGPEYDLIPWCQNHDVLFMAYSPFGSTKENRQVLEENSILQSICNKYQKSIECLSLQFIIRNQDINTVFKTSSLIHLDNNMNKVFTTLAKEEIDLITTFFPIPNKKIPLMKI